MGKAGRKAKPGKRTRSGRLSRAGVCLFDRGSEHTQAMQVLYGQDGADAIGRAYRAKLLGDGPDAKAMLDTARRISNAYWQAYATGSYQCPLADRTHGSVVDLDHERIKRRELWLNECLDFVRRMGPLADRAFRQLVIDVNPDNGPTTLDRLLWVGRQNAGRSPAELLPFDKRDADWLRAALDALEQLSA